VGKIWIFQPLLFAKGKSLKSEGIGMPRDKNKGLHGDLGHVEPICIGVEIGISVSCMY
jgi:hypothetical protein